MTKKKISVGIVQENPIVGDIEGNLQLAINAIEKISKSKLDSLIVTDTIPLSKEAENCKKIKIVSMDSTLAGAITRVNREESISEMFL